MGPDWPLDDPIFALLWQVRITIAALFAVGGVWWSASRLPWYVPPTVLLALLWLLVPLEAPEPAAVLLVATPLVAVACRGIRWIAARNKPSAEEQTSESPAPDRRWRFRLSDSLWLTFLAGLGSALVAQLGRMPWPEWRTVPTSPGILSPDIAINAICFIALPTSLYAVLTLPGWWRKLLASALTLTVIAGAVAAHLENAQQQSLLLDWMHICWPLSMQGQSDPWLMFHFLLRTFLVFTFLVLLGLLLLGLAFPPRWKWTRWFGRIAAGVLLFVPLVELGLVYREMIVPPDWPEETFPPRNRRSELAAIVQRHGELNPQEWSVDDLRNSGGPNGQTSAQQVAQLFDDLDALLATDEICLFDSRTDQPQASFTTFVDLVRIRGVGRALKAQAEADWAAGRRENALRHTFLCLWLGETTQRRSTSVEALVGVALESVSTGFLTTIRQDLTLDERKQVTHQLQAVAARRESQELFLARNRTYDARIPSWRDRLYDAARRVQKIPGSMDEVWPDVCRRRDATIALLQADLAIRAYRQHHGDWPRTLADLVPDYLPEVPVDPFTHSSSLRYRAEGDGGFTLYSVGPDGCEDGGKFGNRIGIFSGCAGFDFDLDTLTRP